MAKLSIIILNYETKSHLEALLLSLTKVEGEVDFELIVVDNNSSDGSVEMVKSKFPKVRLIENKENVGFSKGNNQARSLVTGKYILFLNPDTLVPSQTLKEVVSYMDTNNDVGAMTCKILLPNGDLDRDARRRFPTPWISFKRLFLKSPRAYWYLDIDENKTHEVDAIQGAFFLARKKVLDEVGWFDEDYFLNGEDIDLSWRIKENGWKIIYYPSVSITHIKKVSKKGSDTKTTNSEIQAMEIFYSKRLWSKYPLLFNHFVLLGIKVLKVLRKL